MGKNSNYTGYRIETSEIMVLSTSNNYPLIYGNNKNQKIDNEIKLRKIRQNGQIQIYQSSYRGSYSTIIRDCLRNAGLGRKVLLVQLMKGGVKQGILNAQKLCGNLTWIRASDSYDQYDSEKIANNKELSRSINSSILELWNFCKDELQSGKHDQIILDEIFLAIEMGIIDRDDLISTLENRFITGDVILTGTDIPKDLLLMANQITELRS